MLYNEIKELLLDRSRTLTCDEARDILATWKQNPLWYHSFLRNKDASVQLKRYDDFNEKDNLHVFKLTKVKVLSPFIAEKFLSLLFSDIDKEFFEVICDLSLCSEEAKMEIYAWPYLNKELISYHSYGLVMEIIKSYSFVFNFEEDTDGKMFDKLLNFFADSQFERTIFAVASFNISEYINVMSTDVNCDVIKGIEVIGFSEHFFEGMGPDYCAFRKMFVTYVSRVKKLKKDFINDVNKSFGIFPS